MEQINHTTGEFRIAAGNHRGKTAHVIVSGAKRLAMVFPMEDEAEEAANARLFSASARMLKLLSKANDSLAAFIESGSADHNDERLHGEIEDLLSGFHEKARSGCMESDLARMVIEFAEIDAEDDDPEAAKRRLQRLAEKASRMVSAPAFSCRDKGSMRFDDDKKRIDRIMEVIAGGPRDLHEVAVAVYSIMQSEIVKKESEVSMNAERIKRLLTAIILNDPNSDAADAITLLDVWRSEAKSLLEWPEGSGDPSSCPENEGYGWCKRNSRKAELTNAECRDILCNVLIPHCGDTTCGPYRLASLLKRWMDTVTDKHSIEELCNLGEETEEILSILEGCPAPQSFAVAEEVAAKCEAKDKEQCDA